MNTTRIALFDTHAHLDLEPFSGDLDRVIRRLERGGFPDGFTPNELEGKTVEMVGVLVPGIDVRSSRRCLEIAERSPILHAAAAIHPNSVEDLTDAAWTEMESLALRNDVVAIGETGLDRYWDRSPFPLQIDYFRRHVDLSKRLGKPLLIHCRDAWNDLLPILRREAEGLSAVIHAFSGTPEQAAECVGLGFFISFAGSVTYRNAKFGPLWEAAKIVPLDRLLIETDSPYMPPHPLRGKLSRNEPSLAASVAVRLTELRGEPVERIAEMSTRNARKLFPDRS